MKKIIYAMLCLFIVFCLVGCNEKKNPDEEQPEEPIQLKAPLLKIEGTKVSWTPVLHADSYVIYDEFRGGDDIYTYGLGTQTENSYEIILMGKGTYTVKVKAISNDHTKYTDSELSDPITYECTEFGAMKLEAPVLTLTDNVVSWTAVSQADAYVVNLNGTDLESQTALSYTIASTEAEENVVVKVKAIVYNQDLYDIENSDYSLPVTYEVVKPTPVELTAPSITLSENRVSWEGVDNADGYIVNLNGTDLKEQTETTYTINPSEDGEYEVVVRAVSHDTTHFTNSSTSNKVTYHYEVPFEKVPATLFVVGDSTLASFADAYFYPRYGYGTQLGNYFDEAITVNNLALSGRSSKSFITEDNYTTLKNNLKAGDYLLIGFGHNDEKSDDAARFTDASKPLTDSGSFKYSLYEYYIKLAIEKGATPILCTPIVRADKNNTYTASSGHVTTTGDYAQAVVELGQEKNVTVINLRDLTKKKYTDIGYAEAIYYHAMTAGKKEGSEIVVDTKSVDTTHLNIYGAKYVAYLVATELKKTNNTLGKYVLKDINEPTKDKDLVKNPNYKFVDYASPNLASYQAPAHFQTATEGWYGTAFGDCGGAPSSSGYIAKEINGVFEVGQTGTSSAKGKFASGGDGFAFLFQQISKEKNFEITVTAKVTATASTKQAGFGLMLRDDCYINQTTSPVTITSNYLTAGFTTKDSSMNALFYRENSTLVSNKNTISSLYAVGDTAVLKIIRLGQSITTTIVYKGVTYTETYYDFDLFSIDSDYMYIGMFATRGTVVEFSDVNLTITGTSQGA